MKQIKKSKRFKKRYIFMFSIIFLIAAGILLFVFCTGNHYTFTYKYFSTDYQMDESKIKFKISDESIVKAEKVYVNENNKICIDLVSQKRGDTSIRTYYGKIHMAEINIHVDRFGIILEKGNLTFNGYRYMEYAFVICIAVVFAFMAFSYIESFRRADFSYSMVAYGAVSLYSLAIVVYTCYYFINFANDTFKHFLYRIYETGVLFAIVASLPMFVVSFAMAFSNIWLVRHEGFRPVNLLGIFLGIFTFIGTLFVYEGRYLFYGTNAVVYKIYDTLYFMLSYTVSFMECLFLFIMLTAFMSTRYKPPYNKDYIMILGCGIRKDGGLTPLLRGRADAALNFEAAQYEQTGKHAKFIPSGGQGSDEIISESEAIKRYLLEKGVPEERILKEDKSVNTFQNILFSKQVIENDAGSAENVKAAFATTNYHIFRGYVLSQKHNLDAQGISAKTKWYFYPNAFLREFVGLLAEKKIQISIIIVSIILFFASIYNILSLM